MIKLKKDCSKLLTILAKLYKLEYCKLCLIQSKYGLRLPLILRELAFRQRQNQAPKNEERPRW